MGYGTHTPNDPLVFPIPVQNSGGHYNRTTGIYTAPIDGTYEFIIHILSYDDYDIRAYLVVDSRRVSNHFGRLTYFLKEVKNECVSYLHKYFLQIFYF